MGNETTKIVEQMLQDIMMPNGCVMERDLESNGDLLGSVLYSLAQAGYHK